MCELFGFSGRNTLDAAPFVKELVDHSPDHPHGWGIAAFYGNAVNLEKEPKCACLSDYLNSRLNYTMEVSSLIAHIRYATRGKMVYENCHPFVYRDSSNRAWTLAHNGTIFESEFLDRYASVQGGQTDSERIICHLIQEVNTALLKKPFGLSPSERFAVVDRVVLSLAEHNKLNLLIYDGELMYVHTNMADSLYLSARPEGTLFATVPLDDGDWQPVPFMQLLAFDCGRQVFAGTRHEFEYSKPSSPVGVIGVDWAAI